MNKTDFSAAQETIGLALAFIPSRAIYAAAKLGVADLVEAKGRTAAELAENLNVDPSALSRILRVLVTMGIFSWNDDDRFTLTARGQTLRSDTPDSVRDFVILNHEIPYNALGQIMHTVRTGESGAVRAFGEPVFQHLKSNEDLAAVFHAGLRNRAQIESSSLLDAYDFSQAGKIVDVGGGTGALLSAILGRFENLEGILFDTEPAIQQARSGRGGPLPRCQLVPGDFFKSVPIGGDTYILKFVLHDWSSEDAIKILKRCREAMTENCRLLIIEGLLAENDTLTMTDMMDLTMLVAFGGMERTEKDYRTLLERSGFTLHQVIATAAAPSILEALPC